jgi:uncharacterized protein GlcG (DUF336 family)
VAEIIARIAESEACHLAVPMAIAIVDGEGGLQLFKRMDGTLPVSTELAVSKAYTAAALRMPTHQLGELAQPGAPLYGIQHTHHGRIVMFGGGYPLCLHGEVVGAIGVSGGTVEQDMQVAQPAADRLQDFERWAGEIKALLPASVGASAASPLVREKLLQAFTGLNGQVPEDTLSTLTGGVLLALA